ncbi:hypothetical protein, partial [uncultured Tateyamaria sp.]|uniref:hypothetical protein n=1 Tax=uncultured Tateyamaria sp. TaxID=455651 RepID=UPI002625936B
DETGKWTIMPDKMEAEGDRGSSSSSNYHASVREQNTRKGQEAIDLLKNIKALSTNLSEEKEELLRFFNGDENAMSSARRYCRGEPMKRALERVGHRSPNLQKEIIYQQGKLAREIHNSPHGSVPILANCGMKVSVAFDYLASKDANPQLDKLSFKYGDHSFLVIGRNPDTSTATDPTTWPSDVVVLDAWIGNVFEGSRAIENFQEIARTHPEIAPKDEDYSFKVVASHPKETQWP